MEKIGNDTFKYNGKLYKVVKKEIGHCCSDTCPLRHELDGDCGTICSAMYNQLKNPEFTYEDVVLVEVAPGEAAIKNDEIDWEKLYKDEHDRYEEMCKAEQMRLEQLASWYGALPDGDEKQFEKLEEIFPELTENNDEKDKDEKIRNEIIDYLERFIPHHEYDLVAKSRIWIAWLKKQGEIINEYEDKLDRCACENFDKGYKAALEKQEWSEKDERIITGISMVLQSWDSYHVSSAGLPSLIPEYVSWLNSLKGRITPTNKNDFDRGYEVGVSAAQFNQWKPTEEQLEALEWSLGDYRNVIFEERHSTLTSLYNDLKKLKGE